MLERVKGTAPGDRAARAHAGALLDRMVEASLLEVEEADPPRTDPAHARSRDAPSPRDEADLFVDGAFAFLQDRPDRDELLARLRDRLSPPCPEAEPHASSIQSGAADEPEPDDAR